MFKRKRKQEQNSACMVAAISEGVLHGEHCEHPLSGKLLHSTGTVWALQGAVQPTAPLG